MRALLYARVSMDQGQNPEMQIGELQAFATHRGWESIQLVDKVTGSTERRPGLDQLWKMCRRRQVDAVVVYRFDRFARSLKHLVLALDEFKSLGIQFVSLHDNVDTTTAQGMFMFQIFGAFAEFERAIIQERVRSGIAHARAQGKRIGRPPIGADTTRIATLRAQGLTWTEIGRVVGVSRRTAQRLFLKGLERAKPPAAVVM